MDVDVRIAHQDVVHDHLDHTAGNDGEDGDALPAVSLQDGVGQDHQADEDEGDAQHLQMGAGSQGVLPLGGQHQHHDGGGQGTQAHARRQGQDGDDPEGGGDDAVRPRHCPAGPGAAAAKGIRLMVTG